MARGAPRPAHAPAAVPTVAVPAVGVGVRALDGPRAPPRRPAHRPSRGGMVSVAALGGARAHVAAHPPVQEPEGGRHDVPDVGQAQQHERDAQDRVEYRHHLARLRLRRDVPVPSCRDETD